MPQSINKNTTKNDADTKSNIPQRDNIAKAILRNLNPKKFIRLLQRGIYSFKQNGTEATMRKITFRIDLMLHREVWKYRADIPLKKQLKAQKNQTFAKMPTISIIVPLYNTNRQYLKDCIKSCIDQSYTKLELVLVDASDADKKPAIKNIVDSFKDTRIKYISLDQNEGISQNTNAGIQLATGDWITLLDHDDVLQKNALFEIVCEHNASGADFIYSDEIVLNHNLKKLVTYHFKPDFSPDTLRGCNYITHMSAFSKQLLQKSGGLLFAKYDGAQDFDLFLRLTENAKKIAHIPKVLYMWRSHSQSTASGIEGAKPYALEAGRLAVQAQLERLGLGATVQTQQKFPGSYKVQYAVEGNPKISVLVPSKDHTDDLQRTIHSLVQKAGYKNYEILVIENNSTEQATFDYYAMLEAQFSQVRVIKYDGDFNFSKINNFAAQKADGEYLLLLNNDMQILSDNFLCELLSYAQRKDVGAVGAKLFYPDDTIQHGGVIVGVGGTAGHSHKSHPAENSGDMYRLVTTQNYLAVTGACLMVKKDLYINNNGLDEQRFGVAFNDVDFCLRLWRKGYLNVFTPFATAYHHESKSRGYDTQGANKQRYETERGYFVAEYADIIANGDMYYNPHFTYLYENYGYK